MKNTVLGILLTLFSFVTSYAQKDTLLVVGDSLKTTLLSDSARFEKAAYDTTRGKRLKKVGANFFTTMKKVVGVDSISKRERPRIVFIRSMFVPSFGQFMNKDYWKVPLVYAAAGTGIYFITSNNNQYHQYINIVQEMHAAGEKTRPHPDSPNGPQITIETYARAAAEFRRYRDYSWIAMGLGWTLFAVEANVSAHLKNFDISDNIAMKVTPTVIPFGGAFTAGVKLSLNFK